jgi:very-short-patch-repair endonuclease
VRRSGVDGGRRQMLERDVTHVGGVQVTTPTRTALDLGRLLWRFDALAALDGFLRVGVSHEQLLAEVERFRGFRGVVRLRELLPIADGRSESPAESALRLHWYDAGLPRPELQCWVQADDGSPIYRLDLALPDLKFCAEFDGRQFHSSPEDVQADNARRAWLVNERRWHVEVFQSENVYGPTPDAPTRLAASYRRALGSSWR